MSKIIDKIINNICLDERIQDGTFDIDNNDHMGVFREYLIKRGIDEQVVREFSNLVLEKGKHPERQAYNNNGILVTFPTPEYKERALKKGTHFENDPTKPASNVFEPEKPQTKVVEPVSQDPQNPQSQPQNNNSPIQPEPSAIPSAPENPSGINDKNNSSIPPEEKEEPKPIEDPNNQPKSPEEKEQEKQIVKNIIQNDNNTLEEVINILLKEHYQWVITKLINNKI
jgi:hypothetical protein